MSRSNIWTQMLDLLWPPVCRICGGPEGGMKISVCNYCLAGLPKTLYHYWPENPVSRVFYGRLPLVAATAFLNYNKNGATRKLIHEIKYNNGLCLGETLGMMLGNEISSLPFFREVEMVVPVPLAPKKLKIRGYNQCEYIASGIAKAAGYNTAFNALIRNNYRGSQTKRNRIKRWENVKGSFEVAEPGSLYGKHILLVDDVITTGATLEACASEILKVEKTKISIATLAYTKDR